MQKIALALGCALLAATANADSISTDRPGQSNSPSVVAPGTIQLEGGFTFERETDGGDPNTNTLTVPGGLLRVGVLSFLEARVLADGFVYEERSGDNNRSSGSDLTLGGRVRLRQPAEGYRVAVDPVLLAAAVPAGPGSRVLDLGCGVGAAALCLLTRVPEAEVTGWDGTAYDFDGGDDWVSVPYDAALASVFAGDFTLSLWAQSKHVLQQAARW